MLMLPVLELQRKVCSNVRVLGFVPNSEFPELYIYADVFLMHSLTMESFGITVIESLACATPGNCNKNWRKIENLYFKP